MAEVAALQLLAEPADAAIVQQILHPRMAALLAIAVVALQGDDRLQQLEDVLVGHVAEGIGHAGEGLLLVVGAAHATAHIHVAALGPPLGVTEQHQAHVLGEQVHRVVTRHRHRHLELAGHVGGAVKRLGGIAAEHPPLALQLLDPAHGSRGLEPEAEVTVHPDVQVGAFGRLGGEQIGDVVGQLPRRRIGALGIGGGGGHHVAVDVTAGRQGGAEVAHDRADHLLQVLLAHAVHLEGLPRGGPQGAVAEAIGELIHRQEEVTGDAAAGAAQPQHHLPVLLLALLAVVAVVLLVAAVKLENLNGVLAEVGLVVAQFAQQRLQQVAAVGLELLELGGCGLGGCSTGSSGHRHSPIPSDGPTVANGPPAAEGVARRPGSSHRRAIAGAVGDRADQ